MKELLKTFCTATGPRECG